MTHLYLSLLPGFWRALWAPLLAALPLGCYPPARKEVMPYQPRPEAEHDKTGADAGMSAGVRRHPAMTAPIERASDWDGERPSAEVIELRREGRL